MTAPLEAEDLAAKIRERLEVAAHSADAGEWVSDALSDFVKRYRCEAPERCEGRPPWDAAYDEMIEALMPKADAVLGEAFDQLAAIAAEALAGFAAEYPDAPRGAVAEGTDGQG